MLEKSILEPFRPCNKQTTSSGNLVEPENLSLPKPFLSQLLLLYCSMTLQIMWVLLYL